MRKFILIFLILQINLYGGKFFQYRVEKDDTLKILSDKFKVDVKDILLNNRILNRDFLYKGEVLNIPFNYEYSEPDIKTLNYIINSNISKWKNSTMEVYRWEYNNNVLIFDTFNYSIQALLFKRIAYFVEKKDYAGRIYSYEELQNKRGWNGHDYKAKDLARFFNKFKTYNYTYTNGEKALLEILLKSRILFKTPNGFRGGNGAVISISRSSYKLLRNSIARHEIIHALYFTSPEFRVYSATVWNTISQRNKDIWIMYLDLLGYDTSNNDLVINEFVAYTLQSSDEEVYGYFREVVYYRLISAYPQEREKIDSFYRVSRKPYSLQIGKLRKFTNRVFKNLY